MSKEIILVHESVFQSLIKDFLSALMSILIIGIGVFLKSDAMQWIGFVLSFFSLFAFFSSLCKKTKTPQDVVDYLYDKYGVIPKNGRQVSKFENKNKECNTVSNSSRKIYLHCERCGTMWIAADDEIYCECCGRDCLNGVDCC